jgi:4-amino-4-deoxy-L-arabinose transferase-like glycosyltransferase
VVKIVSYIGKLQQTQLSQIFQDIEVHEKTGLLTVSQDEQETKLYFQQGRLMCISFLHEDIPLQNKLLQAGIISHRNLQEALLVMSTAKSEFTSATGNYSELQMELILTELEIMSTKQFEYWASQEAIEIVQNLLTKSVEEAYFDEGVQPPQDRYPLALRLTSLIPSLLTSVSTPTLSSMSSSGIVMEEPTTLHTPDPVSSTHPKTPETMIEKAPVPLPIIDEALVPTVRLQRALKSSIRALNSARANLPLLSSTHPKTPGTMIEKAPVPLPTIDEALVPTVRLQRALKSSIGVLNSARANLPLPVYDPTAKLLTPKRHNAFHRWEILLIALILLIAALTQGINMFHYPYYEQDEGTYMSQAWALVHLGHLAYYTYFYDHAPFGWIQIAAWTISTGGSHTFGSAINSGRVLVLLFQLGSTLILYYIARSISSKVSIAVIVSLLFTLSPYGIYFHRLVLLDNIATFWMLLSILFLVPGRLTLNRIWLSALVLSISILSKEVTVFLVPVLAYLVFFRADKSHRWFAIIGWIALVVSIVSLYPLMAILNNEFFRSGTFLGGTAPHVSLLATLQSDSSRARDGGLFSFSSAFWQQVKIWMQDDPILVVAGSLSAILSILMIKKHRLVGITGLLSLSLWAFLARGGVIIGYYLLPLLPLLALNVGLVIGLIAKTLKKLLASFVSMRPIVSRTIEQSVIILCLIGIVMGCLGPSIKAGYGSSDIGNKNDPLIFWSSTQADSQNQAAQWIEKNLPLGSHMIIDESMWTDLYDGGYKFADYYWKVQADPAIRDRVYHNNWQNFDYIVTTPELLTDARENNMTLVEEVLTHSTRIAYFDTGGWRVEIRKVLRATQK